MAATFLQKDSQEWSRILGDARVPASVVLSLHEWLNSAHAIQSGLVVADEDNVLRPGPVAWIDTSRDEQLPQPQLAQQQACRVQAEDSAYPEVSPYIGPSTSSSLLVPSTNSAAAPAIAQQSVAELLLPPKAPVKSTHGACDHFCSSDKEPQQQQEAEQPTKRHKVSSKQQAAASERPSWLAGLKVLCLANVIAGDESVSAPQ